MAIGEDDKERKKKKPKDPGEKPTSPLKPGFPVKAEDDGDRRLGADSAPDSALGGSCAIATEPHSPPYLLWGRGSVQREGKGAKEPPNKSYETDQTPIEVNTIPPGGLGRIPVLNISQY